LLEIIRWYGRGWHASVVPYRQAFRHGPKALSIRCHTCPHADAFPRTMGPLYHMMPSRTQCVSLRPLRIGHVTGSEGSAKLMKILVLLSQVPDTTARIAFTDGNTRFDTNGVQFIVNPYDEWYALVRALELKERSGGTVTTVTVGAADTEATIRKGLAIGADEAVRIDAQPTEALQVAEQIAAFAKDKNFDLIMAGKETIDHNGGQVGGMVAELLDMPYVPLVSKLEVDGPKATLERDIPGGVEVLEVTLPMCLSASKGMAEQRIPNMRGIMAARTKPLTVVPATQTDHVAATVRYELPPAKGAVRMIPADEAGTLIELLHTEAKVI
jgi:electron transfer flavoprotein beta subunit